MTIFIIGLIGRYFINIVWDINVFADFLHPISLSYYLFMSIFTNSYSIVSNESTGMFMMADNGSDNGSNNGSDNDSNQNSHVSDEELDPGYEANSDVDSNRQESISEANDGFTADDICNILEGKSRAEADQWFTDERTRIDNEMDDHLDEDTYIEDSGSDDSAVLRDEDNHRQDAIRNVHNDKCISLDEKKEIVYEHLGFLEDSPSRDSGAGLTAAASKDLDAGLTAGASRDSDANLAGGSYKSSEDAVSNEHSNKRSRNDDDDSDNNDNSTKKAKKN